jgi:DNA-binding SARP family transcriptional activator
MVSTLIGEVNVPGAEPTVHLLGRFRVEVCRQAVNLPTQAQRVVGYLAVTGASERRSTLAGRLWPFSPQRRADANLRTALWRIGATESRLLETSRSFVSLHDDVEVDIRAACARARALIGGSTSAGVTVPGEGERLWTEDLLPGWDEEWLVIERERIHQLRIHSLEALSRTHTRRGRYSCAIDAALAAIAAEPLRESAHIALVEAHIGEGNISEARRHYDSYSRLLDRELGIRPSAMLAKLVGVSS